MRTFERVAQLSSFSAAAEELGITRTMVSRHVGDLEAHLGARLLHRTTRAVTLTAIGYAYLNTCRKVLQAIDAGRDEIAASQGEVAGPISVLCPIWIGSFGVSDAVAQFCAVHPALEVRLHFEEPSANPHEFLDRGFDLCIQPNTLRNSSIMVKKIGEIDFQLVASPDYLDRHGKPESPDDLARHDCLPKMTDVDWQFIDGVRARTGLGHRFSTNSVFALCTAAACGLGIAMVPKVIARRQLGEGRLVQVLPGFPLKARPFYVAYAPGGDVPHRVRALIGYLAEWFAGDVPAKTVAIFAD